MLPKELREKRARAKKWAKQVKSVIAHMDKYINSSDHKAIEMAESFYRILGYHIGEGDLQPYNVHLASLLRKNCD